jgi:hypothetical protein
MTTTDPSRAHVAVTDPGPGDAPSDLPYRPPAPGLPSIPPAGPIEEPPLPPAGDPPISDPPNTVPLPSPVTI